MIEAVDRLEKKRMDGTVEFHVATGGNEPTDDIAYGMTFVLNRTFSRNGDLVRRLVPHEGRTGRRRAGDALFPRLFAPRQDEGFNLDQVVAKIEQLVPTLPNSEAKTALTAVHDSGTNGPTPSHTGPRPGPWSLERVRRDTSDDQTTAEDLQRPTDKDASRLPPGATSAR